MAAGFNNAVRLLQLSLLVSTLFTSFSAEAKPQLQQVRDSGTLLVATRKGSTTYQQTQDGPRGLLAQSSNVPFVQF